MQETNELNLIQPVLEIAIAQTSFGGAYVYNFKGESIDTALAGSAAYHRERNTPIVLHEGAWNDERFRDLAEFRANRFEGVVSVPLTDSGTVMGMVNFCRRETSAIQPREMKLLLELGLPLAALLAAPVLKEELESTRRLLEDRKIVERAKGLIQESLGLSEQEAYSHIRLLSRRRRIPMRDVAERIILSGKLRLEASA
jgi:signal transduction protein with GAF and PtsI domain